VGCRKKLYHPTARSVIPAQAGIQSLRGKACVACWGEVGVSQVVLRDLPARWIPACAGMTFWFVPQPDSN